jgi:hypothetical protein
MPEHDQLSISPFCPSLEPAKSIFLAFVNEAGRRVGRPPDVWIAEERGAVLRAAQRQAGLLGLRSPTLTDIMAAERLAIGHSDYGAQWARLVAERMRDKSSVS